tara:strand:- start:340 stop:753 length:414 start_codon:yes stop_codon:yes gene_type:complete
MKKKLKFLIVASDFYPKITGGLLHGAVDQINKLKHSFEIVKVNGSLEIPIKIALVLDKKKYDAIIAIGCIIKGKTDHYEIIANAITNKLLTLSVEYKIPILNAILTCANIRQALSRSSKKRNRAKEAVLAAISVLEN